MVLSEVGSGCMKSEEKWTNEYSHPKANETFYWKYLGHDLELFENIDVKDIVLSYN